MYKTIFINLPRGFISYIIYIEGFVDLTILFILKSYILQS